MSYIYDANVFINYIRQGEDNIGDTEYFIHKLLYEKVKVLIPDLCFYEVIYNIKKKEKITEEVIELLDIFLQLENLIIYKLDAKEYKNILKLAVKYNTSTYDGAYLYLHDLFPEQHIITLDKSFFNCIKNKKQIVYIGN